MKHPSTATQSIPSSTSPQLDNNWSLFMFHVFHISFFTCNEALLHKSHKIHPKSKCGLETKCIMWVYADQTIEQARREDREQAWLQTTAQKYNLIGIIHSTYTGTAEKWIHICKYDILPRWADGHHWAIHAVSLIERYCLTQHSVMKWVCCGYTVASFVVLLCHTFKGKIKCSVYSHTARF